MRRCGMILIVIACAVPGAASAAVADPPADPPIDPAPCFSAIAASDDDGVIAKCAALIDHDKTSRPDRIKALLARAGAFARKDQIDRAIEDDSTVLRLDPTQADVFNARGELVRTKGDRPHAVADFAAALRLNPQHQAARINTKELSRELEQIGADMALKNMALKNMALKNMAVKNRAMPECSAIGELRAAGPAARDRAIMAGKCRPGAKP
jgi:tetratricopeptide (TPR) repeat protein